MMRVSTRAAILLAILLGTMTAPTVLAGGDPTGKIAFARQVPTGGAQIFTINPDGTRERQVPINDFVEDFGIPVWSPNASKLLITNIVRFDENGDCCIFRPATVRPDGTGYHLVTAPTAPGDMYCHVWTADAQRLLCGLGGDDPGAFSVRASDGGGARRLTTNPFDSADVPWTLSPDGRQFAFLRYKLEPGDPFPAEVGIFIADLDGRHVHQVVPYGVAIPHEIASASWSPDGRHIISSTTDGHLFVVRTDGRGFTQLHLDVPDQDYFAFQPAWSPDGRRIVFAMFSGDQEDLYTARADGSNVVRLTNTPEFEDGPDWAATH